MTTRIEISLPDDQVEAARRAVQAGRAPSVSSVISDALARADRDGSLDALLADLDAELGPPSAAALAWAANALSDEP